MPNANYSVNVTSGGFSTTERTILGTAYALTTSAVKVESTICTNAVRFDANLISVAVFR
jgi:hypothetical protein